MKEIYKEYKQNIKYFITKKEYIIALIIIGILSFGFAITNFSVGVDDITQDRYITGTYLLSQGRWGNVLLALIFNITTFIPFWTDFTAVILILLFAIILSAFIRKEIGDIVNKNIYYVIFSGVLISYPIIHHTFIYHFHNVITATSNIAMIVIAIIIYENVFNLKSKKNNILIWAVLPFFISMYEASCQTFLCFIFIVAFINVIKNKKFNKRVFKYLLNCIILLLASIILNSIINFIIKIILEKTGNLTADYSSRYTPWLYSDLKTCIMHLKTNVIDILIYDIKNVGYIGLFFIVSLVTLLISLIKSIKNKNYSYIILNVIIILTNFSMIFIQTRVLYRTNTSWPMLLAFGILYIILYFRKDNVIENIIITISSFIILFNSMQLTLAFYNDYLRYKREKNIAYDIANTIMRTCEDRKKPLIFIQYDGEGIQGNSINVDNGWSIINWGVSAFGEYGTETVKFINSLGYNFICATNEEYEEGYNEFIKFQDKYKKDFIIEMDKYIIVKVIYEPR